MKLFAVILLCSLVAGSTLATTPPLSDNSKNQVITSAITGGVTGLALTALAAGVAKCANPAPITKNDVAYWGIAGGVATAAGALLGGFCEYFSLPEKQFEYAKQELSLISQDPVISILYQTKAADWINTLKGQFCRSRFPLMNAFSNLSAHYDTIVKVKSSLNDALAAESQALRQETQELQEYANATMMLLQAVLSTITAEPNYTAECTAKAQEDSAFALAQVAVAQQMRLANEWNRPKVYISQDRS